ncbi:MAG: capsid protein [Smacoviridae sp.]|uniref:Capsid protein n=1 Tax=Smacoviridae sp. TaxID=2715094 RepID=A0A6G8R649_9VIRU|nr:MAG: capsid protein [Smacoviridae sp.]QIN96628.1 MAG: capsid protein [Smacoviridae sp.]
MVQVRVSETYDLSTQIGKMGLVGIHTPRGQLISRLWSGLIAQHKKFRFVSCDVQMACASMLPADPLQVGVEAGSIAPQDMFNPILYKAVSNDSMSNLVNYLVGNGFGSSMVSVNEGSVTDINDTVFKDVDDGVLSSFDLYYALLADSDGWRKAMPQAGLEMRGLYPLVYQVLQNFGDNTIGPVNNPGATANFGGDSTRPVIYPTAKDGTTAFTQPVTMRGPSMRMPAMNTTCFPAQNANQGASGYFGQQIDAVDLIQYTPACYVGVIVLPPATLNQLYYRLKVTWTVEFTELRSLVEISNWRGLSQIGDIAYGTDYASQSTAMTTQTSLVDTENASISKIMEGS